MDITVLNEEIKAMLSAVGSFEDGEHLWDSYQKVTAYIARLVEIHNQLAWLEISGQASAPEKKFRTMIVDKTIEALEKIANFESRKLTAKKIEMELDR